MLKTYLKTVLSTLWPDRSLLQHQQQLPYTYLLGHPYDLSVPSNLEAFEAEFRTHLLFTYRHSISALTSKDSFAKENWVRTLLAKHRVKRSTSSDGGWGCMIRVFQMAMAQVLLTIHLQGRKWSADDTDDLKILVKIINQFCDTETAEFSIHRITAIGQSRLKLPLTTWYGPTSCARVMSIIVNELEIINERKVRCLHFDDTCINVPEVNQAFRELNSHQEREGGGESGKSSGLLGAQKEGVLVILLSMRLGLENVDLAKYKGFLRELFTMKQFTGLCGGDCKTSAYYFIACNEDYLYFLDPHVKVQPALLGVRLLGGSGGGSGEIGVSPSLEQQYQDDAAHLLMINDAEKLSLKQCVGILMPDRSRQLSWRLLNPSMTVTLICNSLDDFCELRERLEGIIYFDEKEKISTENADEASAAATVGAVSGPTPCRGDDEYLLV